MSTLITAPSPSGRTPRMLVAFAAALVLLGTTAMTQPVLAQDQSAQQPAAQLLTAEQLDQLVAPIALYPDNLLGQILTASTYPLEDVMAARWAQSNPGVKGAQLESAMQQQNWDPSVKALAAVPQVLAMMNDKLDWTQQLGDAYLAQPDDVAAAIQRLRLKAQSAGNLQTTSQQRVRYVPAPEPIIIDNVPQPNYIEIEPVDPTILYVPVYNPVVVFGPWAYPAYPPFFWSPPGFVVGVGIGVVAFSAPFVVGPAIWATYDWRSRHVDIDADRFNRFNHTTLASTGPGNKLEWQHDPGHRGPVPYSSPLLQNKFKGANNASLGNQKILTTPTNLKGVTTNPTNLKGNTNILNTNTNTKIDKNKLETNIGNTGNTGNTGNSKGTGQNKITTLDKLNTGNNNNNGGGNNGQKNFKTEEHHVDIKGPTNPTTNNNVIHNQTNTNTSAHIQQNFVIHNNPPPPPPPPHNNGGGGGGNQNGNNQKDKKHP